MVLIIREASIDEIGRRHFPAESEVRVNRHSERRQQSRSISRNAAGRLLFIWQPNAPYLLSGTSLIALALGIAWKVVVKRRADEFTL